MFLWSRNVLWTNYGYVLSNADKIEGRSTFLLHSDDPRPAARNADD
jgi:hypothetical protein